MPSSTLVCRNFMSCSDLQETTTCLKLKVLNKNHCSQDQEDSSFQYSFDNKMMTMLNTTKPYNSFLTRLSQESLELCTENLGSETGTETIFTSNVLQEPSVELITPQNSSTTRERTGAAIKLRKSPCVKNTKGSAFPPPLTTMCGTSSLQVTRHRENGRLIIQAVERPLRNGVLQAERSGGRLRLCFLKSLEDGGHAAEEYTSDEVEEETVNDPREAVDDLDEVEKGFDGVNDNNNYQWMSRCKGGGNGGNINMSDGSDWNKRALWVVTS